MTEEEMERWKGFKVRTPDQIQRGVDAFDHEYTDPKYYSPNIFGKMGPQMGYGKPMPPKNEKFNELLFEFLGIRERKRKEEMTSRGNLMNMWKGPDYMENYQRRLYG